MIGRAALALGAALLAGAAQAQSPFAGAWRGTWSDPNGQYGSAVITIDDAGAITGTVANQSFSVVGPITGRTTDAGRTHMTYTYDGGRSYMSADGTMVRTDDRLVGNLAIHTASGRSLGIDTFRFTGPHATPPRTEFGPPGNEDLPPGKNLQPDAPPESLPSPKQQ